MVLHPSQTLHSIVRYTGTQYITKAKSIGQDRILECLKFPSTPVCPWIEREIIALQCVSADKVSRQEKLWGSGISYRPKYRLANNQAWKITNTSTQRLIPLTMGKTRMTGEFFQESQRLNVNYDINISVILSCSGRHD